MTLPRLVSRLGSYPAKAENSVAAKEVAILIAVYNEEKALGDVLRRIPGECDVYVVDDASTDRTVEVAKENEAKVISLPVNLGQGAAAIAGFRVITAADHPYVVKMDGDGQHDPAEIPRFVEALQGSEVDIVQGSRVLGADYRGAPLARRVFLRPLTWVLNRLTGYRMTDAMCGFRAFRGESLKRMVPIFEKMVEPRYIASEMWIRFARAGFSVAEIPIRLAGRTFGCSSKGLFRYGWGVCSAIVRTTLDGGRAKTHRRGQEQ